MSYTLLQQFSPQHAHFTFSGNFLGKQVTWDTHLYTVMEYARLNNFSGNVARQLIDISEIDTNNMKLIVALNVVEIDPPTIQKMMIMISQYKKLALGRHEYGDEIRLKPGQEIHN